MCSTYKNPIFTSHCETAFSVLLLFLFCSFVDLLIFKMTLDLQEAGSADIDEIGALLPVCYINDPILSQVMPTTPLEKRGPFWAGWIRDEYSRGADKLFKVTDSETG
jgi:hypothetical protein